MLAFKLVHCCVAILLSIGLDRFNLIIFLPFCRESRVICLSWDIQNNSALNYSWCSLGYKMVNLCYCIITSRVLGYF